MMGDIGSLTPSVEIAEIVVDPYELQANTTYYFNTTTTVRSSFVFTVRGTPNLSNTVIDGNGNTVIFDRQTRSPIIDGLISFAAAGSLTGLIIQNLTISSNPATAALGMGGGWFVAGGRNVTLCNCLNTAPPFTSVSLNGSNSAGIVGAYASNCVAYNCGNIGLLTHSTASGIFGGSSISCAAYNCYNTSPVPSSGGGIFGYFTSRCTASNCYNTGTLGDNAGPIFSKYLSSFACFANNCYNQQTDSIAASGVTVDASSGSGTGVWSDATASLYLKGVPITFPGDGATWISLSPNTRFNLIWQKTTAVACFLSGTRILTPLGQRRIETLEDYDDVLTSDGRSVYVKIHKTHISKSDSDTAPFLIPRNAFSHNVPDEDLHISGLHAFQDPNGVWNFPMGLAIQNRCNVTQHLPGRSVTYYHIECPNYYTDNIVANNLVTESFRNRQGKMGITYEYCEDRKGFVRNQEDEIKDPSEIPPNVLAVYC